MACSRFRLMPEQMIKYAVALHNAPQYLASLLSSHASHTSLTKRSASPFFSSSSKTDNKPEISPAYLDRRQIVDTNRGVSLLTHCGRFEATGSCADASDGLQDWSAASNAIANPLWRVSTGVGN